MLRTHAGELYALATAIFWTITALTFESASRRVGELAVNLLRLTFGFILLSVFSWLVRGLVLPVDAPGRAWFWLLLSGLVGFVFGDHMLLKAFTIIGSRIAMLVSALVPPLTALLGWLTLGEHLTMLDMLGMAVTLAGIALVILERKVPASAANAASPATRQKIGLSYSLAGLLYALGGAVGQAIGLILSKIGMGSYNAFAATQIRIIAGVLGFMVLFSLLRRWGRIGNALKNRPAMTLLLVGSVFGPFLGVSFSLLAIQNTSAGVASTIMALVPVLIIFPSVFIYKERVSLKEAVGAVIAVSGVALLFV